MLNRSNQRINYFRYLGRKKFQSSESPYYFAYGRTAIKAGLLSCKINTGKKILVPEFICDAALHPFHELGLGIQYYSVKEDLSPDWDSVHSGLSTQVAGIMMVHYFGIPQDIERFTGFARENNLILIEDNSHGHGGSYQGKMLGLFGDIGISSPRKSFPILNGGTLFLKNALTLPPLHTEPEPFNVAAAIIRDLIGRILDTYPRAKEMLLNTTEQLAHDSKVKDWCIDKYSYKFLAGYDLQKAVRTRTQLFRVWEKWSRSNKLTPLFSSISDSYAPLAMPLLFGDQNDADKWMDLFKKNHIAAFKWPYLPREISETMNSGKNLYDRIVCLPIHLAMKTVETEGYLRNKFKY